MYGQIGWDFDAADVMAALAEVEKQHSECVVHLHSPGGYVIDGFAIFNALRRSRMAVTVSVDGMAASMAAIVMLAADRITAASNAMIMIHAASGCTCGGVAAHQSSIKMLGDISKSFISEFRRRTGMNEKQAAAYMDGADHWLTAAEAQQIGFIDDIYDAPAPDDIDMQDFTASKTPAQLTALAARMSARLEDKTVIKNELNQIRMRFDKQTLASLGLTEDANETQVAEATKATIERQNAELKRQEKRIAELEAAMEAHSEAAIKGIIDRAVAERRISESARDRYTEMGKKMGIEALTAVLDDIAPAPKPSSLIKERSPRAAAAADRKWEDYTAAELSELREQDREQYDALFAQHYGFQVK